MWARPPTRSTSSAPSVMSAIADRAPTPGRPWSPMYRREALAAVGIVVRATTPPEPLATALAATVRSVDTRALLTDVRPMTDRIRLRIGATHYSEPRLRCVRRACDRSRFGRRLWRIAGRRPTTSSGRGDSNRARRERGAVCRALLRRAFWLAGAGLAIGGLVSVVIARLMVSLLDGLEPLRSTVVLTVAAGLVALVVIAAHMPALRQILRLDPSDLLRGDAG